MVQTAALLILQPIFEADLEPTAYGYRPRRSALEAVQDGGAPGVDGVTFEDIEPRWA